MAKEENERAILSSLALFGRKRPELTDRITDPFEPVSVLFIRRRIRSQ